MSHRLWFRLDEILPLAEHAMACRFHPPTGAQAAAVAPDGPALIVQQTTGSQVVRSNGFPIWYDQTGLDHAAHAHTWRHPARAYPDTFWPRHGTAYLPLHDTSDGRPPVIDLLRAGRYLRRGWLALHIDPDRPLLDAAAVQVRDHRDDLLPADAGWRPAMVRLGTRHDPAYPALVPDGYTTADGDLLPRFDRRTVDRIVADLGALVRADLMPGEYPVLRRDGDTLVLLEEHDAPQNVELDEVDRCRPDRDGLYSLGAYLLAWRAEPDTRIPIRDRTRLHLAAARARLRRHR